MAYGTPLSSDYRRARPVVAMLKDLPASGWRTRSMTASGSSMPCRTRDSSPMPNATTGSCTTARATRGICAMRICSRLWWSLLEFHGPGRRIVWAHNSHVGDAVATEMTRRGEYNVGHLCRRFGQAYIHWFRHAPRHSRGGVHDWDGPMQRHGREAVPREPLRAALHEADVPRFCCTLRPPGRPGCLTSLSRRVSSERSASCIVRKPSFKATTSTRAAAAVRRIHLVRPQRGHRAVADRRNRRHAGRLSIWPLTRSTAARPLQLPEAPGRKFNELARLDITRPGESAP